MGRKRCSSQFNPWNPRFKSNDEFTRTTRSCSGDSEIEEQLESTVPAEAERCLLSELRPSSGPRMRFSGDKENARRVGWRENASGCAKPADNFRPLRWP